METDDVERPTFGSIADTVGCDSLPGVVPSQRSENGRLQQTATWNSSAIVSFLPRSCRYPTREKRVITPVPSEESFFRKFHDPASELGHQCLIKDTTAFMGRSFRVGWGPNGILAHLGSSLAPTATTKKSSDADMSFTIFGPKSSTGAASLRHSPYYTVTLERVVISPTMIPASPNIEV